MVVAVGAVTRCADQWVDSMSLMRTVSHMFKRTCVSATAGVAAADGSVAR